ncbi:MAG: helix-turn-helix domain-containing protein [Succinivibrio sp.]
MSIKIQVGHRIRQLRNSKGISQEKLALEVGLDRTYITSVENGKRNISIVNLEKIWTFFELTPSQFFDSEYFNGNYDGNN